MREDTNAIKSGAKQHRKEEGNKEKNHSDERSLKEFKD